MQKQQLSALLFVTFVLTSTFSNCKSSLKSTAEKPPGNISQTKKISRCDQTIVFHSDKLMGGEREISANIDITVSPSTKLITIAGEVPSMQQKISFETVIEIIDCNFNTDLTRGYSIYKGYTKQSDGSSTPASFKIEAKDGKLSICDPDKNGELVFWVSKWTVATQ